jgi:hypothetical protein
MDPVRSRVRSVGPLVGGLWPFVLANGSGPRGPPWAPMGPTGRQRRPFGVCVCARVGQQKKKKGPEVSRGECPPTNQRAANQRAAKQPVMLLCGVCVCRTWSQCDQ